MDSADWAYMGIGVLIGCIAVSWAMVLLGWHNKKSRTYRIDVPEHVTGVSVNIMHIDGSAHCPRMEYPEREAPRARKRKGTKG